MTSTTSDTLFQFMPDGAIKIGYLGESGVADIEVVTASRAPRRFTRWLPFWAWSRLGRWAWRDVPGRIVLRENGVVVAEFPEPETMEGLVERINELAGWEVARI